MSNSKFSLTKVLVECPELVEGCIDLVCSAIPDDTKVAITDKLANSYTALQSKWKSFCGNYEEQLKSFLPFVGYVHDMTAGNDIFWFEESGEFYYGSVEIDEEERHEYKLSINKNGSTCLDVIIFINELQDKYFCIGQEGLSLHPLLDKKLSDLFLLVEDMVSKEGCPEPDQEEDIENQTTIEDRRIPSFISQLIVLTEKRSITWKAKEGSNKRFRVLIKKRNDIQILVELMRDDNGSVEVRAAQVIDKSLKKMFHIAPEDCFENSEMEDNVKHLYALVESECL
ncbi:MAG: hypothetical protein AB7V04_01710 [Desulfomonilaceae bacterium]